MPKRNKMYAPVNLIQVGEKVRVPLNGKEQVLEVKELTQNGLVTDIGTIGVNPIQLVEVVETVESKDEQNGSV